MDKPTKITTEDLLFISQQKAKTAVALAAAEKANADYRVSESEYRSLITGVYYKYGLTANDKVSDATGEIIYATQEVAPEAEQDGVADAEAPVVEEKKA